MLVLLSKDPIPLVRCWLPRSRPAFPARRFKTDIRTEGYQPLRPVLVISRMLAPHQQPTSPSPYTWHSFFEIAITAHLKSHSPISRDLFLEVCNPAYPQPYDDAYIMQYKDARASLATPFGMSWQGGVPRLERSAGGRSLSVADAL